MIKNYTWYKYKNLISSLLGGGLIDVVTSVRRKNEYLKYIESIKCICFFIGTPRSGTSLLGSLLDAHPNIMISHELDIGKYFAYGLPATNIISMICANSTRISKRGRKGGGYDNQVQTGWQGKLNPLYVAGDKKAAMTSLRLANKPSLLDKIRNKTAIDLKFLYITRNPFDVITSMWMKNPQLTTVEKAIELYVYVLNCTNTVIKLLRPGELIVLRLEDVVESPAEQLNRMCKFLYVEANSTFIEECSRLLFSKPKRNYEYKDWPQTCQKKILEIIESDKILSSYA